MVQAERAWADQVWDDLRWVRQWASQPLPDLSHATWPNWWHLLAAPGGAFKKKARTAAQNYTKHASRDDAVELFLMDLLKDVGVATTEMSAREAVWCCPPCKMGFGSKSALSVHFRKKHCRKAAYRRYAVGSLCHACGVDFFTQRRLLLHLRGSSHCCDVLAAMGKVAPEHQEGIRQWKPKASAAFVLCPPTRAQPASTVAPNRERVWKDHPEMEEAFWRTLDWLVYFEGTSQQELYEGIVNCFASCPFYTAEFRLILRRLHYAAVHLVQDEEIHLWGAITPAVVQHALMQWSSDFDSGTFMSEDRQCSAQVLVKHCELRIAETWRGVLPASLEVGTATKVLRIGTAVQGTRDQVTTVSCTYEQALQLWSEDQWQGFVQVHMLVQKYREEGLYLCTRHLQYPSLELAVPAKGLYHVLRCCWQFARRGRICIEAADSFWCADVSLPFRAMRTQGLFHCN